MLCSRTENKLSGQTNHLYFHNIQRSHLSVDLSRPEVARSFNRSQVSVNFTHCSPEPQGGPKHGARELGILPLVIPQAPLYGPVNLDICPESEDV